MKYLLIFLLTFSSAFAIDVEPIKAGEAAPKDGFFVDAENMKKIRQINEDKKRLEAQKIKLEDLGRINEQRISIYRKESENAYKEASRAKLKGFLGTFGGFVVGVSVTGLAFYVATKVVK